MACKALTFFLLSTLLIAPCFSLSPPPHNSHEENTTGFEFFKHLQGSKKGDKMKAVVDLKKYLKHYGYLNSHNKRNDDLFDDRTETAIKTYQRNFNLKITGVLDPETLSVMKRPRCGQADIINGTNFMRVTHNNHNKSSSFHHVSHFAFFRGRPRWPASKYRLTYAFPLRFPARVKDPIARAFKTWERSSKFKFTLISRYRKADLTISFQRGDHGDGHRFDGPGGYVAHAFAPRDGRMHLDADDSWAVGAIRDAVDVETVALHEIGHLLGLHHSSVRGAVMYPIVLVGGTKRRLNGDDIRGIRALYP